MFCTPRSSEQVKKQVRQLLKKTLKSPTAGPLWLEDCVHIAAALTLNVLPLPRCWELNQIAVFNWEDLEAQREALRLAMSGMPVPKNLGVRSKDHEIDFWELFVALPANCASYKKSVLLVLRNPYWFFVPLEVTQVLSGPLIALPDNIEYSFKLDLVELGFAD